MMKTLHTLALCALIASAVSLGMGSAFAQGEQSKLEQPSEKREGPTERDQGPHMVTMPTAERTAAEAEADRRAQQERADEDTKQRQDASQAPAMDRRMAQDSTPAPRATPAPYLASKPANSFHVDQLLGSDLKSRTDAGTVGSIGDLVIDEDGQILAVIVEVGGFLGLGQKDVAIPWDSVERTLNEKGEDYELYVSASKDALRDAPEYKSEVKR